MAMRFEALKQNLERFNRKERFHLVRQAMGIGNPRSLRLCDGFRERIRSELSINVPNDHVAFIDYHLDWLHVSLVLTRNPELESGTEAISNRDRSIVTATQTDSDLLVAFGSQDGTTILMIEAKAESSWSNEQMERKRNRLEQIFGAGGTNWPGVQPVLVLTSPREPRRLNVDEWPEWMLGDGSRSPGHMILEMPGGLVRPERCKRNHETDENGGHFHLVYGSG